MSSSAHGGVPSLVDTQLRLLDKLVITFFPSAPLLNSPERGQLREKTSRSQHGANFHVVSRKYAENRFLPVIDEESLLHTYISHVGLRDDLAEKRAMFGVKKDVFVSFRPTSTETPVVGRSPKFAQKREL